jgi:hypothetical protein
VHPKEKQHQNHHGRSYRGKGHDVEAAEEGVSTAHAVKAQKVELQEAEKGQEAAEGRRKLNGEVPGDRADDLVRRPTHLTRALVKFSQRTVYHVPRNEGGRLKSSKVQDRNREASNYNARKCDQRRRIGFGLAQHAGGLRAAKRVAVFTAAA